MTKSKIFFYFCLSFIFGIFIQHLLMEYNTSAKGAGFISSIVVIPQYLLLGFLIFALIPFFVLWIFILRIFILRYFFRKTSVVQIPTIAGIWTRPKIIIFGFCLIFLVLGIWRNQTAELKIRDNELKKSNDSGEIIILTGRIIKEPDVRINSQKLTIQPEEMSGRTNKNWGRILVNASRYPEYKYGDRLIIKGRLETPGFFEDFNYADYLAKSGIYSVIYWPEINLSAKNGEHLSVFSLSYDKILNFKKKLREVVYQNLSPPQSSILTAMILGDRSIISDDLKQKLNISGVSHIIAISGMNVVILTNILMLLLIGLGFWRNQAFYFSIILISLFIIMIGFQASAVRAGIMGGILLLGQKVGRKSVSSRTIVLAAAVMLAFNPLLLAGDVGFQLSFLATMGIIYLGGFFENLLKTVPEFLELRSILSMTFSAYIFTLPILIYNFGRISLIGPIVNVLVLPIIPLIMFFGFSFMLFGAVWSFLAWIFSFPIWLLLTYFLKIVDLFSSSGFALSVENVPWIFLAVFYLILAIFVRYLNKKERLKFLDY